MSSSARRGDSVPEHIVATRNFRPWTCSATSLISGIRLTRSLKIEGMLLIGGRSEASGAADLVGFLGPLFGASMSTSDEGPSATESPSSGSSFCVSCAESDTTSVSSTTSFLLPKNEAIDFWPCCRDLDSSSFAITKEVCCVKKVNAC